MKRSKQREAILEILCSTTSHPTANALYDMVRKKIPNISLGTVYRNLNALSKSGEILKIDSGHEHSHYDGNAMPHDHFVCKICQRVYDVNNVYDSDIDKNAQNCVDGKIEYHSLLFFGVCDECNKKA